MQFTNRKHLHTVRMAHSRTVRTVRTVQPSTPLRNSGENILSPLNDMLLADRTHLHTVRMSNSRTVRTVQTVQPSTPLRNSGENIVSPLNDMLLADRKHLHTVRMSHLRTVRTERIVYTIYRLEKLTDRNLTFTDRYSAGVLDNPQKCDSVLLLLRCHLEGEGRMDQTPAGLHKTLPAWRKTKLQHWMAGE